jgi:hypothetical protein
MVLFAGHWTVLYRFVLQFVPKPVPNVTSAFLIHEIGDLLGDEFGLLYVPRVGPIGAIQRERNAGTRGAGVSHAL